MIKIQNIKRQIAKLLNYHEIVMIPKVEYIKKKKYLNYRSYDQNFSKDKVINIEQLHTNVIAEGLIVDIYLTGKEICDEIIKLIESANKSIYISSPWVSNKKIIKALSKKKCKKFIRTQELKKEEIEFLNAEVKLLGKISGIKTHGKYCIIDNKYGIVGSFNFSDNGERNYEVAVKVIGEEIISSLNNAFKETLYE